MEDWLSWPCLWVERVDKTRRLVNGRDGYYTFVRKNSLKRTDLKVAIGSMGQYTSLWFNSFYDGSRYIIGKSFFPDYRSRIFDFYSVHRWWYLITRLVSWSFCWHENFELRDIIPNSVKWLTLLLCYQTRYSQDQTEKALNDLHCYQRRYSPDLITKEKVLVKCSLT